MTEQGDDTPPSEEIPNHADPEAPLPPAEAEGGLVFEVAVEAIRAVDDRYAMDAYQFVREALDRQVSHLAVRRHITGPELLDGVQRLAYDRFGPMARTVLNHWGLVDGEDVGRIVFQLVEAGILSKTEDDRLDDFAGVIRFDDLFEAGYRWP
jgi:uncharacterized repeat protein (TIGR04138 family)